PRWPYGRGRRGLRARAPSLPARGSPPCRARRRHAATARWSPGRRSVLSQDVDPPPRGQSVGLPEARLGAPAHRLLRVFRLQDRERAAALEEAAERQPARAAHLDQRELSHVVLVGRALDDGDLARAVEHDGYHLPGLDELAEALGLVAGPHAARPVRVFLDRVLGLGRLLPAIEG